MRKNKAFTLVELLITSSIFVIVILTIYSAFCTGIFGYRNIEETIAVYQAARQILDRINLDLRNSFVYSNNETKFIGSPKDITFLTLVNTFSEDRIVQDYALVSYKLKGDKLMRLCRKNKEALNENSGILPEEMASGVEMTLTYFYIDPVNHSLKEKDSWNIQDNPEERQKLPVAIKVGLIIKNKIQQEFERKIFLSLAETKEVR